MKRPSATPTLAAGALTLVGVWTLLVAASFLVLAVGAPVATALAFAGAAALAGFASGWPRPTERRLAPGLAAAAGFASYPAWVAGIAILGLAGGLAPRAAVAPPDFSLLAWLPIVLLAPFFEELLYRRLLIPPLRRRIGALPAIAVTSALFAAPHLEPWQILGTFLVGLALGALFVATGDVWLCIAVHAGLNAATLVCGSPPVRLALDPIAAALAGLALGGLALLARRGVPSTRHEAMLRHA